MNSNDTKTAIAKVHCKKPENLEQAEPIPLSHFTEWLASGERGVSSNAIVSRLTGLMRQTIHGRGR